MRQRLQAASRNRAWWPVWAAVIALLIGLAALAATPVPAAEPVLLYSASTRPAPIPLDPDPVQTVDLNHASRAELEALPGIGTGRATAILDARAAQAFASLADVVARGVLPEGVAETLAPLVHVDPGRLIDSQGDAP